MKKKAAIIIGILGIIVIWLVYSWITLDSPKSSFDGEGIAGNIDYHWNIKIPKEGKLVYEVDDVMGFPMDGLTYAVFSYPDEVEMSESFEWTSISRKDKEKIIVLLKDLSIEKRQMPSFEETKMMKEEKSDNTLYILYDEKDNKLFIIELIM